MTGQGASGHGCRAEACRCACTVHSQGIGGGLVTWRKGGGGYKPGELMVAKNLGSLWSKNLGEKMVNLESLMVAIERGQ